MASVRWLLLQFLAIAAVAVTAVAVEVPGGAQGRTVWGASRDQVLLQARVTTPFQSLDQLASNGGQLSSLRRASLVDTLSLAKGAARSAVGAAGWAERNATQAEWAQTLIEDIENNILPGIFADHEIDQKHLHELVGKVQGCLSTLEATNATAIAPSLAAVVNEKAELEKQEGALIEMNETQFAFCNSTHALLSSHSCVMPTLPHPDHLASYMDCVQKWLNESQTAHAMCDEAYDSFTAQEKLVDNLREKQTLSTCSLAADRTNACGVYTACRVENGGDYIQSVHELTNSTIGRRMEVQAVAKIMCFLEVVMMSHGDLATEAGRIKFENCETHLPGNATLELSLDFPSISQDIRCPLQKIEAMDCVRKLGCEFDVPVRLTSHRGEHLQEINGSLSMGAGSGPEQRWILNDAGDGKVLISSYSGKHLQDFEGVAKLDINLQAWAQWTLQDAGSSKVLLTSSRGQHLQDFQGTVKLHENVQSWGQWTIQKEDGTDACFSLPSSVPMPAPTPSPLPPATTSAPTPAPTPIPVLSEPVSGAELKIHLDFSNGFVPQVGPADLITGVSPFWDNRIPDESKIVDDPTGLPRKVLELPLSPIRLKEEYFQFGTDDFAMQMDQRRNFNGGNSVTFTMKGNVLPWGRGAIPVLDFYNDYVCVEGFGCRSTNCCDWSEWHTHKIVRKGGEIIQYIDGVETNRIGNAPDRAIDPLGVFFVSAGGFTGHIANFTVFH